AKGSAPIGVIGTKYDPATPYSWAQALHKSLSNSVLLTWEGDGHTAYTRAGSCIQSPVDKYLLTGEVPKDGLDCPAERPQGQLPQKQGAPDRKASVKDEVFVGKPRPFVR
ncbi:MAG: alpha/beta hydrolase, partial [Peptidiphaga gingivicola]